jgi:hypothetical protein
MDSRDRLLVEIVGTRRVSLALLRQLDERTYRPEHEPLLERAYQQLLVGQVYKTTRRNRFEELDSVLVEDLSRRFHSPSPLVIHDVGASNAITSLELFRRFEARGRRVHVHASDFFDSVYFVDFPRLSASVVFAADKTPLQYIGPGLVLSAGKRKAEGWRRRPFRRALSEMLDRTLLSRAKSLLDLALELGITRELVDEEARVERVRLVHPEVKAAAARTGAFSFGRHDLFSRAPRSYHVVRALNILNPGYFTPDRLRAGVEACASSLVEGGILVVGRTIDEEDSRTRASAFVRDRGRLSHAWDLNEGSEIRALVEQARMS